MKKVIILGIGNAQVDAIAHCKERGYEVIGLSYRREGRGLGMVDRCEEINIVDKDAVLNYARDVSADLVYSVGSDIAMPTIGYVADRLGTPSFVTGELAELLENKGRLRAFLQENDLNPITFMTGKTINAFAQWNQYPAIIKPVDSQGQRGVYVVHDEAEISERFPQSQKFSRCGDVILEEYVDGPEISVNAFVYEGQVVGCFISDRFVVKGHSGGLICGHELPAHIDGSMRAKVKALVEGVIGKLRIKNGPVYFQLKCMNGDVFVIEVTARLDGCHLWRLIHLKYGLDLLALSFDLLLTGRLDHLPDGLAADPVYPEPLRLDFYLQEPDVPYRSAKGAAKGVLHKEEYYCEGDIVRPINGYAEKVGYEIRVM